MTNKCMYTCVYVPSFSFKTRCSIVTCKYNSDKCVSGCMYIERKAPVGNKTISDDELAYYKAQGSSRVAAALRKKAILATKSILVLDAYISFLNERCSSGKIVKKQWQIVDPIPSKYAALVAYTTSVPYLMCIQKIEMLILSVTLRYWNKFLENNTGDVTEMALTQVLMCSPAQLAQIKEDIRACVLHKDLFVVKPAVISA